MGTTLKDDMSCVPDRHSGPVTSMARHRLAHSLVHAALYRVRPQLWTPVSQEPLDRSSSNLDTSFTRSVSSLWEGGGSRKDRLLHNLTIPSPDEARRSTS